MEKRNLLLRYQSFNNVFNLYDDRLIFIQFPKESYEIMKKINKCFSDSLKRIYTETQTKTTIFIKE